MKPSLALSMIVRNGGDDLPQCLASVRGIADEIVIADTGSTDSSIAVAESFGARVISILWENDFAAARNAALHDVRSDWILVLDADEQLDAEGAAQIGAAIQDMSVDGYRVTIRNYVKNLQARLWDRAAVPNDGRLARAAMFPGYLPHQNVRLFRNRPEIYFEGRVHETVGERIVSLGGKLKPADFLIHHFGFTASAERREAKKHLYRDLGLQKIKEMPRNAQAHFEVGLEEFDSFHNYEAALPYFVRACELNPKWPLAWFFRGMTLAHLRRSAEALPCLQQARQLGGNPAHCWEAEGDALYNTKQFAQARQAYRKAIKLAEDPGLLSKLGLTELRLGHNEAGLKKLQSAVANAKSTDVYDRFITGLVSLDRIAEAARISEDKLRNLGWAPSFVVRTAVLWSHAGQPERAFEIAAFGLKEFPSSVELRNICEQLRLQCGSSMAAQKIPELKLPGAPPIGNQNEIHPEPKSADAKEMNRTSEKEYQHVTQHT